MTPPEDLHAGIPAAQLTPEVREALARLAEENARLRAALDESRTRIGDLEQGPDVDPITGLAGRQALVREVERAVSQADRHGTPSALITIDLRGLRTINERHGRDAGDAALTHVAKLLGGLIRSSDRAARCGAGFALLLDHLDPDSAVDTGERITQFIAQNPLDHDGTCLPLEAVTGVATILPGDQAADVLDRARRNLERVKEF